MKISECKAKLFEMIMSGKGLQEIFDDCSALLGNPFAFANRSFQLVCKSSSCGAFPDVFGWLDEWGEDTIKVADEAMKAGYFKAIYSSDAPVPRHDYRNKSKLDGCARSLKGSDFGQHPRFRQSNALFGGI